MRERRDREPSRSVLHLLFRAIGSQVTTDRVFLAVALCATVVLVLMCLIAVVVSVTLDYFG